MTNNLKSWQPGQSGNPKGKPKGTRNLSTWINDLLNDDQLLKKYMGDQYAKEIPIQAIVTSLIIKAVNGDVRSFEILAKYGYSNKIEISTPGSFLPEPILPSTFVKR